MGIRIPMAPTRCAGVGCGRSEEHTSELQSQSKLVCRLLLEKNNNYQPVAQIGHFPITMIYETRHASIRRRITLKMRSLELRPQPHSVSRILLELPAANRMRPA